MDHFYQAVTTFPSKSRRDLPGSQLWGRSSHLLTPAACTEAPQEGDRGEGGVSGKRHQLGGIGPCGDEQQPDPALLHKQWWEPKVVSSNYYARVHSNRPLLCGSLQKRSSLAPRQSQAHQQEQEFGVNFPVLRSEQRLFS